MSMLLLAPRGERSCAAAATTVVLLGLFWRGDSSAGLTEEPSDITSLMQQGSTVRSSAKLTQSPAAPGVRDLVFVHIPYNFGHSLESQAFFSNRTAMGSADYIERTVGGFGATIHGSTWADVRAHLRDGGEVWGHLNPDLQVLNNQTGCPMYYSPPKFWPQALQQRYFGNKTVFGILRDPYERLIAMARGHFDHYGGFAQEMAYILQCDLNTAIQHILQRHFLNPNRFHDLCTFVEQAEFFEGPYGITLPVNNREFPASVNRVLRDHGYNFYVNKSDIMHVEDCGQVWAGDLSEDTKAMVRRAFPRDFALLCRYFGYCTEGENCCIYQVDNMCPQRVMAAGYHGQYMAQLQ